MKQNLVKILEKEVDVSSLSEKNIEEYVQAKQTVDSLKKLVIDPFAEYAKQKGKEEVYSENNLVVSLKRTENPQKLSDKAIVSLLESTLNTILMNNANNKPMHGVRRFKDVVTVDPEYLNQLYNIWQDTEIGQIISERVTYKGKDVKNVAHDHKGRLALITEDLYSGLDTSKEISQSDLFLYIVADYQSKLLNKKILRPFEEVFKNNAQTNPDKTLFDNKVYGRLTVQIKTVPRRETDYEVIKDQIQEQLNKYIKLSEEEIDNKMTFYNKELKIPKPYVSVTGLLELIKDAKTKKEIKYRQEISILYAPEKATILTSD